LVAGPLVELIRPFDVFPILRSLFGAPHWAQNGFCPSWGVPHCRQTFISPVGRDMVRIY